MTIAREGLSYWQAEGEGTALLGSSIGDRLDRQATKFPTKEAIIYSQYPEFGDAFNIRWTYQEFCERANAVARGLIALGLRKGEHIAVWAINLPEWPLLMMAAAKAGLVVVAVNAALRASEVEYILRQGDVRMLFFMPSIYSHDCIATIRALVDPGGHNGEVKTSGRLPMLQYACVLGAPPGDFTKQTGWRPMLFHEVIIAGEQISGAEQAARQALVTPSDLALMLYTSGTTGFPKGALLSHYNLLSNALQIARQVKLNQDFRACVLVSFFHVFGCVSHLLVALCVGGTICPALSFSPVKAMQIIRQERCSFTAGVPTMLLAIMQHPEFSKYDLSSLKQIVCSGAPVPVSLMMQVEAQTGANVFVGFGQTEATACITLSRPGDPLQRRVSTVGVALLQTEIKIINQRTGEIVPCGQSGELCCRGYQVMQGYYKMPEKTAEVIDPEGWLHTGDLAVMDTRGYVNIVGRIKDMVIRGGENIFPHIANRETA